MLPGVSGRLISEDFAERLLCARFEGELGEGDRRRGAARLQQWWRSVERCCGPASSVRQLVESAARPLAGLLGFEVTRVDAAAPELWSLALAHGGAVIPLIVVGWSAASDAMWRRAVRSSLLYQASWCLIYNGPRIRLIDAGRLHARRHVEFELPDALEHAAAFDVLWAVLRAPAFVVDASGSDLVGRIVRASDEEGLRICATLRAGVREGIEHLLGALVSDQARRRSRATLDDLHAEALTAVYRLLFLLFAEARRLVPTWHPLYRRAYSVESLRLAALRERSTPGLWEGLQAIGRLAHEGCRAGDLNVTAFNGRLFSPLRAPRLERARLEDAAVREALLAVSTVAAPGAGRQRIAFRDLGVEELGGVYEALLEYEPRVEGGAARTTPPSTPSRARAREREGSPAVRLARTGAGRRKATGTFYTPRSLTGFLVQQTLEPVTEGLTAEGLLDLRVCDPAMGSGAFLVAACRHLARAYEKALVTEGACRPGDLDERDRAGFRRLVAQRCLFGVDLNPMAVQLARLSLWLTTLAADHPLTFLDHHVACGDSLLGAAPADLLRGPRGRGEERERQLPLFDPSEIGALLTFVLPVRRHLSHAADATAAAVQEKEAALAGLVRHEDVRRWRAACDVWCANWCRERPAPASTLRALLDHALRGAACVPERLLAAEREEAARASARLRFFHWPLEFPEVFFEEGGAPRTDAGFDAVVGNPPWEMLRDDDGGGDRSASRACARFARRSGLYAARVTGHANQYQLFVERALALTRPGGRIGLVVPAGLAIDAGAAPLRRRLLHECRLESVVGFENRAGLFPIHRSTRFLLITAARGGRTAETRCRFGLQDPAALDEMQEESAASPASAFPVVVSPALLARIGGPDLPIPHVVSMRDLTLAEKLASAHPRLVDPAGWNASFGRELNATDHRRHFTTDGRGLPVVEGKHVTPFRVEAGGAALFIDPERAGRLLGRDRPFLRARLAFRDVAGATNRQTVIAALVPAGCVTTHTLFCLRSRLALPDQRVLCALLNSHALDFLVRQRVTTHVTLAVMRTMPVPRPERGSPVYAGLERGARMLEADASTTEDVGPEVQALAAAAFGLTAEEFASVLSTFPLVPDRDRQRALEAFTRPRSPR